MIRAEFIKEEFPSAAADALLPKDQRRAKVDSDDRSNRRRKRRERNEQRGGGDDLQGPSEPKIRSHRRDRR